MTNPFPLKTAITENVSTGHVLMDTPAVHGSLNALPRVVVDADNSGNASCKGAIMDAMSTLPGGRGGLIKLTGGDFLLDEPLDELDFGVVVEGCGKSGATGVDAPTCIHLDGNMDHALVTPAYGGFRMLEVDGGSNEADGFYLRGSRSYVQHVGGKNLVGDVFRIGGKVDGVNANCCRLYDIHAFTSSRAMYVHDVDEGPNTPNANSFTVIGFDYRGNADGITVERSLDGELYGLFGATNGGYGLRAKAGCHGLYVPHPYLEENTDRDVWLENGSTYCWVGPPRSFITGDDWVDDGTNNTMIVIPNNVERFQFSRMGFTTLDINNPAIGGHWRMQQAASDRALEISQEGSTATPIPLRILHNAGGVIQGYVEGNWTVSQWLRIGGTGGSANSVEIHTGTGSPVGVLNPGVGSLYLQQDGSPGSQVWVHHATGSANWTVIG